MLGTNKSQPDTEYLNAHQSNLISAQAALISQQSELIEEQDARIKALEEQLAALQIKSAASVKRNSTPSPFSTQPYFYARRNQERSARTIEPTCILFTDIVGYTALNEQVDNGLVYECVLNPLFSAFDELMTHYNAKKVKTIGDAYMASQVVSVSYSLVSMQMISLGVAMLETAAKINDTLNKEIFGHFKIQLRIGISIGECNKTVSQNFIQDYFGHVVNTASRMESSAKPNSIQISDDVARHVFDKYNLKKKRRPIKGLGTVTTYEVLNDEQKFQRRRSSFIALESSKRALLRTSSSGSLPVQLITGSAFHQTEQYLTLESPSLSRKKILGKPPIKIYYRNNCSFRLIILNTAE